jgi:hypothetical protein
MKRLILSPPRRRDPAARPPDYLSEDQGEQQPRGFGRSLRRRRDAFAGNHALFCLSQAA